VANVKSLFLMGLLTLGSSLMAAELPKAGLPEAFEVKAHPGELPSRERSVLGFTLGKHSLTDVRKRFPKAPIGRLDSSDGSAKAICLEGVGKDRVRILFEAGPLGGFETLTAATVGPPESFGPAQVGCIQVRDLTAHWGAAGKIRLGARIDDVAAALKGKFGKSKDGLSELNFERNTKRRDKQRKGIEIDILSGVVAQLVDDRIQWYSIYYVAGS
jgi:hypothetical protein